MMMKTKILMLALSGWMGLQTLQAQNWGNAMNQGGNNAQEGLGTARDNNGDRVVVGYYQNGTATFGSGSSTVSLANGGGKDGFVTRYNQFNTLLWAARISGTGLNIVKSVVTGDDGSVYVCGQFSGYATFYHKTGAAGPNMTTGNDSYVDAFLVKYNDSGMVQWVKKVAFSTLGNPDDISNLDYKNGTLAVTGYVGGNTSSGAFPLYKGTYVAKINPASGNTIWAYTSASGFGGSSSGSIKSGICIDNSNKIYILQGAGNGSNVYSAGGVITLSTTTTNSLPYYACYTTTGNLAWHKITTTTGTGVTIEGASIAVDDDDNLYIAGGLRSVSAPANANFPAVTGSPIPAGGGGGFIGRIDDSTGNAYWLKGQPGFNALSVATQPCGLVYAAMYAGAGSAMHGTSGGPLSLAANTLYVGKWHSSGQLLSTASNVWKLNNTMHYPHLDSKLDHVDLVGTLVTSTPVPLNVGGTITLTSVGLDMLAATIIDLNPFPTPTVSLTIVPNEICEGDNTTLNVTVSVVGGPYTYTWQVYNPATMTYVDLATTSASSYIISPAQYIPYMQYHPVLQKYVATYRVKVTGCYGLTYYSGRPNLYIHKPITYGGVTNQEVCIGGGSPSAVFGVSAPGANAYSWQVSCDGGASWSLCSLNTTLYSGYNTASLMVNSPGLGMSGCQYRCILGAAFCPGDTTNPATLTVVEDCFRIMFNAESETVNDKNAETNIYPNPSTGLVTLLVNGIDNLTGNPAKLYLRDISGKLVIQYTLTGTKTEISLHDLSDGVYLYSVQAGSKVHNGKLVLTR